MMGCLLSVFRLCFVRTYNTPFFPEKINSKMSNIFRSLARFLLHQTSMSVVAHASGSHISQILPWQCYSESLSFSFSFLLFDDAFILLCIVVIRMQTSIVKKNDEDRYMIDFLYPLLSYLNCYKEKFLPLLIL